MSLIDIILLAVALAMDCFTISIVSGIIMQRPQWRAIAQMGLLFGLFQALMPFVGWLAMVHFAAHVEHFGHWLAMGLLTFIGGRMVWQSLRGDAQEEQRFNPTHLPTQLWLALATSIDALAVGISMAFTGFTSLRSLVMPLVVIGLVSLVFTWIGHWLGLRVGKAVSRRMNPELLGGLLLIAIGLKILIT